jgi:hypothetical protein
MFRLHLPLSRRLSGGRSVQRRARPKPGGPEESRALGDQEAGEDEEDETVAAALERLS